MNQEDELGFLVAVNANAVLGISISGGHFVLFTYDGPAGKLATHQVLTVANLAQQEAITGYNQVISVQSRRKDELFIVAKTEDTIHVFQLNYPNMKSVQLSFLKTMDKLVADCICVSYEEPQFFVSTKNVIRKVLIDPNPGTKCLVSK